MGFKGGQLTLQPRAKDSHCLRAGCGLCCHLGWPARLSNPQAREGTNASLKDTGQQSFPMMWPSRVSRETGCGGGKKKPLSRSKSGGKRRQATTRRPQSKQQSTQSQMGIEPNRSLAFIGHQCTYALRHYSLNCLAVLLDSSTIAVTCFFCCVALLIMRGHETD